MGNNWTQAKLGDYVESCLGKMLDKNKNTGEYHPYLGNSNVRWGAFELDDLSEMKFEAHEHERYGIIKGDLIICEGGEPGRCAIWEDDIPNMKIQKALHRVRPLPGLDSEYLYYWLLFSTRAGHIDPFFTGTTIKHLTGKALKEIPIKIPPLKYQQDGAKLLRGLDKKITLNQKTNQTLEQMAQALFKSWFVDFDPVVDNALDAGFFEQDLAFPDELLSRAEARRAVREHGDFKPLPGATRQLFPTAFEECAEPSLGLGGWVPQGWVAATLSDLADVVMGQSPKGDTYNSNGVGIPLINGPVEFGEYHPVKSKWTTSTTKMSEKNDLIVCVRGSTTGRYVISDGAYCLGRGVCAVRGGIIQPFITYQFKNNIATLLGLATGSTFPSWSGPLLKKHIVLNPSIDPIKKFCTIVGSNLKKMGDLDIENIALSELRDALLPKLISGELCLDNTEAELAKEGVA